jgi:hypothetical protein
MGIDVKEFREVKMLEKIIESEKRRGKGEEDVREVVRVDRIWREVKTELDEVNCAVNGMAKEIKEGKVGGMEIRRELIERAKEMNEKQRKLKDREKGLRKERKKAIQKIGNIVDVSNYIESENEPTRQAICNYLVNAIIDDELIKKQTLISIFYQYFQQQSYFILQTPSFISQKLYLKVFPHTCSWYLKRAKPQVLIKNPHEPFILSNYKSKVQPSKSLILGVCFSKNLHQTEKISLVIFSNPTSNQPFSALLQECSTFLTHLNIPFFCTKQPTTLLSHSASSQYTFFTINSKGHTIKLCRCSNHTNYLSKSSKITLPNSSHPYILTAEFSDLFLLSSLM